MGFDDQGWGEGSGGGGDFGGGCGGDAVGDGDVVGAEEGFYFVFGEVGFDCVFGAGWFGAVSRPVGGSHGG
ncbi:hypothetical protein Acor_78380 [Acrocarpospora corrugata]|uniref:Uncharacterized protein n=1 Tax=Acrocarpospora corrugata TaxID=35763 RepID=A0A5M3WBN1_9ACTN|nr:hypothetical protein Acor_78380 [Acrocarpospora corrugata]